MDGRYVVSFPFSSCMCYRYSFGEVNVHWLELVVAA